MPIRTLMLSAVVLLFAINSVADEISYIDIQQAKRLYDEGALFIDTRTWFERKLGKIEGAVAMNKSEIRDMVQYVITDKSQAVVTYCAVGERATDVAAVLEGLGYSNLHVIANGQGYSHWKQAGYPISP